MRTPPRKSNRGPSAAAENRRLILDAARRLFAAQGYRVALVQIAKEAGVGQGVLYRHFPTRLDLAFAVFEGNFGELDVIAAQEDDGAFVRLWARLVDLTLETAAFLEMVIDARRDLPEHGDAERLLALVETTLPRAQAAGMARASLTAEDVLLAQRMIYGVVVTTDSLRARADVNRALAVLDLPGDGAPGT